MTISIREGESTQEFYERWKKIDALSQKEQDILSSEFTINKVYDLAVGFSFSPEDAANIARIIRLVVLGDLKKEQLEALLEKKFFGLDTVKILKIRDIIFEVLNQEIKDEKNENTIEKLFLTKALEKFPIIGEQMLTSAPLKLRIFSEPVKPSIKNWIADYYDCLGKGSHGSIERGNYLFHSENTKKLTSLERRRLAEILKSLDDGEEISVSIRDKKVFFENKSLDDDNFRPEISSNGLLKNQNQPQAKPVMETSWKTGIVNDIYQDKKNKAENRPNTPDGAIDFSSKTISENSTVKMTDVGRPSRQPVSFVDVQDKYEFSLKKDKEESVVKNSWNPGENVRRNMTTENLSFGSSRISVPKSEGSQALGGSFRFSFPQTLPTEKKRKELPSAQKSSYIREEIPVEIPASVSSQSVNFQANNSRVETSDDLMQKIKELKKQQNQKPITRPVYRITPMGFVQNDVKSIKYGLDQQGNEKISGNVVDLRN